MYFPYFSGKDSDKRVSQSLLINSQVIHPISNALAINQLGNLSYQQQYLIKTSIQKNQYFWCNLGKSLSIKMCHILHSLSDIMITQLIEKRGKESNKRH